MAEFKINDLLDDEISAVKSAADSINGSVAAVPSQGVASLIACSGFIKEHTAIKELLQLYQSLLDKEVEDLTKMAESVRAMDSDLSNSLS